MSRQNVDLRKRVEPKQQRAKETVKLVLDTSALLLEESGIEGLTTGQIAQRAGIHVRNVYRYFPNKLAIISALAERVFSRQLVILQQATRQSKPTENWRIALRRELATLIESFGSETGLVAIRLATQASPGLRKIEAEANEKVALLWCEEFRARGMQASAAQRLLVARTAVRVASVLLDYVDITTENPEKRQIDEISLVLESYLGNYLD